MSNSCNRPSAKSPAQHVHTQMQLAMLAGMLNCSLSGSDIWQHIPCRDTYPTPQELIAWAAQEAVRRVNSREKDT